MDMHEDSPPPFIVIRTPVRKPAYEQALELVRIVQQLVDDAKARFYMKDRLDRAATAVVFELSKTRYEPPSARWRHYRSAQTLANDCATIIDILVHQQAAPAADLEAARKVVHDLLAELRGLG
jgi:hypothetical protein